MVAAGALSLEQATIAFDPAEMYSLGQRYCKQNTYQRDFTYFVGLLYHLLVQRGWDRTTVLARGRSLNSIWRQSAMKNFKRKE